MTLIIINFCLMSDWVVLKYNKTDLAVLSLGIQRPDLSGCASFYSHGIHGSHGELTEGL